MAKKKDPCFEDNMRRLQEIVQELERPDLSLERNVSLYKEGCSLVAACREMLEKARHEIRLCNADGADTPFTVDAHDRGAWATTAQGQETDDTGRDTDTDQDEEER